MRDGFIGASVFRRDHSERAVCARGGRIERERRLEFLARVGAIAGHEVDRARLHMQHRVGRIVAPRLLERR